jgi:colanic acid/amylovoran biosynthesis glycosyltransferase
MMVKTNEKGILVYVLEVYPQLSETFVVNEIAELRRRGFQVRVIALRAGDGRFAVDLPDLVLFDANRPVRLLTTAKTALARPRRAARLAREVLRQGGAHARLLAKTLPAIADWLDDLPEVARVHTHFAWSASAVGAYVAAMAGRPLSMTVHARDIYVNPARLQQKIDATDILVTVCDYNRQWLAAHGYQVRRLEIVPCGVELPDRVGDHRVPHEIVGVGRLVPKKGFDLLIRAGVIVRRQIPDLKIRIIGDGTERPALEALIDELRMGEHVELVGAMRHSAALDVINSAQIFVLPCRVDAVGDSDALPVVLREAMARGAGVISTTVAGIPETIDSSAGWLVPPDDVDALAAAIIEAIENPAEVRARAQIARELIASKYTLSICADRFVDALQLQS